MGVIPNLGQERSKTRCVSNAWRLVSFFLFFAALCFNYESVLLVATSVATNLTERIGANLPLLRRDTMSQSGFLLSQRIRKNKFRGSTRIVNPAFGGRGFYMFSCRARNSNGPTWDNGNAVCDVSQQRHSQCCVTDRKVVHRAFDGTLGFPGEGWSKDHLNLKIGTWNTRSLTFERFNYCKSLHYDVLAITELWRNQQKFQDNSTAFIVGEAKTGNDGAPRFPNDRAAGVGILLSATAQQKVMAHGSTSERVCFVRLEGPVCNLFIVACYLPHRGRTAPSQDDTICDLHTALKKAGSKDCIVLLGDFNEQLPGNIKNRTGKWVAGEASKNANKIMDLMQLYDLFAVNTQFEPKRGESVHTYLCPKPKNGASGDFGLHVGERVACKYKGNIINGVVTSVSIGEEDTKWNIQFDDGHAICCGKSRLKTLLKRASKCQVGKQIDHILVSNRWRSSVTGSRTRWGPSIHRSITGKRSDHALLECTWKWRLRKVKTESSPDFSVLQGEIIDEDGNSVPNKQAQAFQLSVQSKLQELKYSDSDSATIMYSKMCEAITFASKTLPTTRGKSVNKRKVSKRTRDLYDERVQAADRPDFDKEKHQKKIRESGLQDFKNWVKDCANELNNANGHGDTKRIHEIVKQMEGKPGKPAKNLTEDEQGNMLKDASAVASRWYNFLSKKFSATVEEQGRDPMPELPSAQGDTLTTEEAIRAIDKLSTGKACGLDGIPGEVYKYVPLCNELLVKLLQRIWIDEEVPVEFAKAVFIMLYKNKGSSNDPSKYRCIGLLGHAYKALSQCMLARINVETAEYLSDWQAGFRETRGCRDNTMIMRTLFEDILEQGRELCATFIDYSAAFDSVSHKYIDTTLQAAGASVKTRRMFRAIYEAASAVTRVQGTNGSTTYSDSFPIRRGVLQGDITSPIYFILALEAILRDHDCQQRGVRFGNQLVHTLGYADDAALLDNRTVNASARVSSIAVGSKKDADMIINVSKTVCMHVRRQEKCSPVTDDEAKEKAKFVCQHVGCNYVFHNYHGLKIHMAKCKRRDIHIAEKIIGVREKTGSPKQRFVVRWQGYGEDDDTLEPYSNLPPYMIKEFLIANDEYDFNWKGARCPLCDKPCKNERGIKCHMQHCYFNKIGCDQKPQNFKQRKAEAAAKVQKLKDAQATRPSVKCEDRSLKNVFLFQYLGSIFAADGSQQHDVNRRIAMAKRRCGQLRNVFDSPDIPLKTKLVIYKTAVVSLMTYGCEAWSFTPEIQARINGANAICLSRITGKTVHQEASAKTQSYDIVEAIRQRKWKWLGHVLRYKGERLTKIAIKLQFEKGDRTNMLQDIPAVTSFDQLVRLAQDRSQWNAFKPVRRNFAIRQKPKIVIHKFQLRSTQPVTSVKPQPPRVKITKPSHYRDRDERLCFLTRGRTHKTKWKKPRKGRARKGLMRPKKLTNKEKRLYWQQREQEQYAAAHSNTTVPPTNTTTPTTTATETTTTTLTTTTQSPTTTTRKKTIHARTPSSCHTTKLKAKLRARWRGKFRRAPPPIQPQPSTTSPQRQPRSTTPPPQSMSTPPLPHATTTTPINTTIATTTTTTTTTSTTTTIATTTPTSATTTTALTPSSRRTLMLKEKLRAKWRCRFKRAPPPRPQSPTTSTQRQPRPTTPLPQTTTTINCGHITPTVPVTAVSLTPGSSIAQPHMPELTISLDSLTSPLNSTTSSWATQSQTQLVTRLRPARTETIMQLLFDSSADSTISSVSTPNRYRILEDHDFHPRNHNIDNLVHPTSTNNPISNSARHTPARHTPARHTPARHTPDRHTTDRHTPDRHTTVRHTPIRHTPVILGFNTTHTHMTPGTIPHLDISPINSNTDTPPQYLNDTYIRNTNTYDTHPLAIMNGTYIIKYFE